MLVVYSTVMSVLSNEERVKILSDIIEIQSVNEKELDVAHYLQNYLNNMILIPKY